jgi:hypothetical protein
MRYIIADPDQGCGWDHIFEEDGRDVERETRFVFDLEEDRLVTADIRRDWKWRAASAEELSDLQDSLVDANRDALDYPDEWALIEDDVLPDWAGQAGSPAP